MTDEENLITVQQLGAFVLVHYRGRQANDLYLAVKDSPVHCCQCGAELEPGSLLDHVWLHAPKRLQAQRKKLLAQREKR